MFTFQNTYMPILKMRKYTIMKGRIKINSLTFCLFYNECGGNFLTVKKILQVTCDIDTTELQDNPN